MTAADLIATSRPGLDQWLRRVRVVITDGEGRGRAWTNYDGADAASPLKLNFGVEKTSKGKPNPGKFELYNLAPDVRAWITPSKGDVRKIALYAGYEPDPPLAFMGTIDKAETKPSGLSVTTAIEARDGGATWQTAKMVESYAGGGGQTTHDLMKRAAERLGLPIEINSGVLSPAILRGYVAVGRAADVMNELAAWSGAEWSIQDETIIVTAAGEPRDGEVFELSGDTGLIEASKDKKENKIKILLNARILPKDKILVTSRELNGLYTVTKITHSGDSTSDSEFYSNIIATEAKR